jgi:hypothetical protein
LPACTGLGGVAESCSIITDASACTSAPCQRLVIIFSGGEEGCGSGAGYTDVMSGFAAHGWAAACVNVFETSTGSDAIPYAEEADRYDLAIHTLMTGAWGKTYWTGDDLLLQGISHGASAPVIAMARTTLDDAWHGARKTAACFLDGTYDQYASAEHLRTGAAGGGACTIPVSYQRWLERYCGPGATTATCDLQTVPASVTDTITTVDVGEFAIHDFRLVECGSALPVCTGDILPAPPIRALCDHITASGDHRCTFASLPDDGHLTCHKDHGDDCRVWFEGP